MRPVAFLFLNLFVFWGAMGGAGAVGPNPVVADFLSTLSPENYLQHLEVLSGERPTEGLLLPDRFSHRGLSLARQYIQSIFTEEGYENLRLESFTMNPREMPRERTALNFFVEVPGRTHPGEIILVGAHYDSQGIGIRGADDNASGASAVLTLAQALRQLKAPPERTIRLVLFDAEETGFHGSLRHLGASLLREEKLKLFINLDMIGYSPTKHRGLFVDMQGYTETLTPLLELSRLAMPSPVRMKPRPSLRPYRSDHIIGSWLGVPALGLVEHIRGRRWETHLRSPYVHTPEDVVSAMDAEYAFNITRFLASLALTAANSELSWNIETDPTTQQLSLERVVARGILCDYLLR